MAWVATENFRQVDRLLSRANPTATLRFMELGPEARLLMRYQASEDNRYLFQAWDTVQLVYGVVFFFVMVFGSRESKYMLLGVLLLLVLTALQKFLLTRELVALGRLIDFVPENVPSPDRDRFWVVHTAYAAVEAVKWALCLVLTGRMVFSSKRSGRSRDSRRQFDSVDKANYRGVNR